METASADPGSPNGLGSIPEGIGLTLATASGTCTRETGADFKLPRADRAAIKVPETRGKSAPVFRVRSFNNDSMPTIIVYCPGVRFFNVHVAPALLVSAAGVCYLRLWRSSLAKAAPWPTLLIHATTFPSV